MKKTIFMTALSLSLLSPTAALGANTLEVVQGDTLSKIAAEYKVSISDILKTNPAISDSNRIIVGQTIDLPNVQQTAKQENDQTVEQQILRLVNEERSKAGLPNVEMDTSLSKTATLKSEDMRDHDYFNHTSPTYGSPFDMMKAFGITYKYAGENISAGQPSGESVMKSWMNSPGHKANILNKNYTHIGIGHATGGKYSYYWTQQFIGK
ncbi:CAP domain-containing protein [Peribacillus muralis]|uniref:CAP domain-containing protein n=1 Tax=Peribacillus muralis TaxID=264697 RepID=UPI003CFD1981